MQMPLEGVRVLDLTGADPPAGPPPLWGLPEGRRPRTRDPLRLGAQYIADAWISEVKWLGITISPSYVGEPGVIRRFMRTLKEQCLYLHRFQTLEEARAITSRSGLSRLRDRRQNDRRRYRCVPASSSC
jgi:hypothetical protein